MRFVNSRGGVVGGVSLSALDLSRVFLPSLSHPPSLPILYSLSLPPSSPVTPPDLFGVKSADCKISWDLVIIFPSHRETSLNIFESIRRNHMISVERLMPIGEMSEDWFYCLRSSLGFSVLMNQNINLYSLYILQTALGKHVTFWGQIISCDVYYSCDLCPFN